MKRVFLVDVSSLFFRSFYAIRNLTNSKGQPTNAIYGFLSSIVKILSDQNPSGVVFCFDRPEPGFREEMYPEYKANRSETPEDLIKQFPYLPRLAEALNIPTFEKAGFEADDVIGSLSLLGESHGFEVVIVSSDKDLCQLIKPGVVMFDPAKDAFLDIQGVKSKLGVNPDQVVDYLSLVGDSSDNVPGVAGIGPKGAQKLLDEFKTLDGIYANLDLIKNEKLREKLRTQKDQAYLSKKLVTIDTQMNFGVPIESLLLKPVDKPKLQALLGELEFKGTATKLLGNTPLESPKFQETVVPVERGVQSEAVAFADLPQTVADGSEIWIDISPRGIAISVDGKICRFEGDTKDLQKWIRHQSRSVYFSGYDCKEIGHALNLTDSEFLPVKHDVRLMAYCLGSQSSLELGDLTEKILNKKVPELMGPEEHLSFDLELARAIDQKLTGKIRDVYEMIERPLVPLLFKMESEGILLDFGKLAKLSEDLAHQTKSLELEIHKLAGFEFNIGSPKQLGQILFEKMALPHGRRTKTGFSTDSDVLEELKKTHPIAEKLLEWREISKLKSTYIDTLPKLADPQSRRIHTRFNQTVTTTGRLSSHNPNLQNIPIRTSRGQSIRECFIPKDGFLIVSADYSQVELRILAHITDDDGLRRAFENDVDIHSATASEIFDVSLTDVTSEHRRASKAINFGIAYGMSDFGLASSLGIKREEAQEYIRKYFTRYPKVQQYMFDIVETGKKQGYVETIYGRRRYYPDLNSSNRNVRMMAERAVINMPIQGSAADIMKLAMLKVSQELQNWPEVQMLLQVHDELVFEVPESKVEEFKPEIQDWMQTAVKLKVPTKVSVGSGKNWNQAH